MPRMQQIIETLEAEREEVQSQLDFIDAQLEAFREHAGEPAKATTPARSNRRATARRASARRHAARAVKRDAASEILAFLEQHPGSTAGDIAKGLDLDRKSVAGKLAHMQKVGKVAKAQRGYSATSA